MKIVIIGDTHLDHEALGVLSGDVLIHCGDVANCGSRDEEGLRHVDRWFARQNFRNILCIGGNHDFILEAVSAREAAPFKHAQFLVDEAVVIGGVKFYGTPWIPDLAGMAFFQGQDDIVKKWASIPDDTDVLITHTPSYGILDRNTAGQNCGCHALSERLSQLQLRLHCFGHIHASSGMLLRGDTHFVNASMVDRSSRIVHAPYEVIL